MPDLNYSDLEALRPKLVPRCIEAVRKYLLYVQGGGGSPATNQVEWCTANMSNLASIAEQVSHYCMSEPTFRTDGTNITDTELQARIETVLSAHFIPAAE